MASTNKTWKLNDAALKQAVGTLAAKAAVKGKSTEIYDRILARLDRSI